MNKNNKYDGNLLNPKPPHPQLPGVARTALGNLAWFRALDTDMKNMKTAEGDIRVIVGRKRGANIQGIYTQYEREGDLFKCIPKP